MAGATSIVKNSNIEKWVNSCYGMALDVEWGFGNVNSTNVLSFGIDGSSSSLADNLKTFLVWGEGNTFGINGSFGALEKRFGISVNKTAQNIVLVCIIMLITVICFLMEKKSLNLKPTIKMLTFYLNFVSEVYLMDLVLLS